MNGLINRITWGVSFILGFVIFYFIGLFLGGMQGMYGGLHDSESILIWICCSLFFGVIIKKTIYSSEYISERIFHFAKQLSTNQKLQNSHNFLNSEDTEKDGDLKMALNTRFSKEALGHKEHQEITIDDIIETPIDLQNNHTTEDIIDLNDKKSKSVESLAYITNREEKIADGPSIFGEFCSKSFIYIKEFFSTNTLAKVGSLLIFIGFILFLRLHIGDVWDSIGPKARLSIAFLGSFSIYLIGNVIYAKGIKKEGIILIGLGLLLNYTVILAGRYMIGENSSGEDGFLTEGITFMFLIFNTLLAVFTSLFYNSRTLLIFSFLFAYITPFLIGSDSNGEPYTLAGYAFIVTLGGLFLASRYYRDNLTSFETHKNINVLLWMSFILGNILIFLAPFNSILGWSIKLILSMAVTLLTLYIVNRAYKEPKRPSKDIDYTVYGVFIVGFIFLYSILFSTLGNESIISSNIWFLLSNICILLSIYGLTRGMSYMFSIDKKSSGLYDNILLALLFFPLVFWFMNFVIGDSFGREYFSLISLVVYMGIFMIYGSFFSSIFSIGLFVTVGIVLVSYNIPLSPIFSMDLAQTRLGEENMLLPYVLGIVSSLGFMMLSYYYSMKKGLSSLFFIGTLGAALILLVLVSYKYLEGEMMIFHYIGIGALIIFALAHMMYPFINKKLITDPTNLLTLAGSTLVGALFLGGQVYIFGQEFFPGIILGCVYVGMAILYCFQSFVIYSIMQNSSSKNAQEQSADNDSSLSQVFYTYAGISVSLFSLAMAFVFSKYPEVISTIWLFEATIVYYLYGKYINKVLLIAGHILFFVGIGKGALLLGIVEQGDYSFLVTFSIIFTTLLCNVYFIDSSQKHSDFKLVHYILHIIGCVLFGVLLGIIVKSTGTGWSTLAMSIFVSVIGVVYSFLSEKFLKYFYILLFGIFCVFHIAEIGIILNHLERADLGGLKLLQYAVTLLIVFQVYFWRSRKVFSYKKNKETTLTNKNISYILMLIAGLYAFIITSIYIYNLIGGIFGNYSLTIYWGLLASFFILYGIIKDTIKFRTFGLYLLILTCLKIGFYDILQIGDSTSRVVVLMILGIVLVILSTLYTKKFGNNILSELSFNNLRSNDNQGGQEEERDIITKAEVGDRKEKKLTKKGMKDNTKTTEASTNKLDLTTKRIDSSKITVEPVKTERVLKKNVNNKSKEQYHEKETSANQLDFMKKLSKVDVSKIKVLRFYPNNELPFTIRSENIKKITKLVVNKFGKSEFAPGELDDVYNYIFKRYKTKLTRREYDKLRTTLKDFIDDGGRIDIIKI